jgi:hypothetical protein
MSKGNPECADTTMTHDRNVFVAKTLSQQNKTNAINKAFIGCFARQRRFSPFQIRT